MVLGVPRIALGALAFLVAALAAPATPRAATSAADTSAATTILLVRHAEKSTLQVGDVSLSTAGSLRAKELARVVGEADIDTIVVTPYRRNRETAAPLAQRLGDSLLVIDPVDETVRRLRADFRGKTVLVVGHSNTVPQIVAALTGREQPPFEEGEYDRLDVVTLIPGRPATHVRLRYGAPRTTP